MQPLTSKLAAHLGTSHIEILDYLDYEAEQAASVIDRFADDIATLPVAHHYIIQMHVHKLSQNLPNLVGKSVYDALLRCGERSAGSTTAALVKAIPLDYMPVRITTQEAVGGGILKAVIRTVKGAAPVIALTKNAIRDKFYDLLIEPIKRTVLEKIVLGGAAAIQRLMQTVRTTVNPQKLAQIFVDGISSGKDRRQIATDLRNELGVTRAAAKRLTRTEGARVASESNMAAYEELGDMVMGYQIHAVLDERTRPQHRIRNGTIYYKEPVGSQKSVTEMPRPPVEPDGSIAWNCILPGAVIEGVFEGAVKSWYSGQVVELVTRAGRKLSITPNHPICTDSGFVRAGDIKIGDNLVCNLNNIDAAFTFSDNKPNAPTTIENVFAAAKEFWPSSVEPASSFNFHGDAPVNNSNVEVVYAEWVLLRDSDPSLFEFVRNLGFPSTDFASIKLPSNSSFFHNGDAIFLTTPSLMSLSNLFDPVQMAHFRPFNFLRFGLGSQVNASRYKMATETEPFFRTGAVSTSGDTQFIAELFERFPSVVTLDDVIEIWYSNYSGHVYDLQSPYGYIIANDVYISNCRCYLSPVFRPLDNFDRSLFRNAEKQIIGDLITYDDWFRQATERQKRIAVGSRRYDQVTKKHGENASYFHFVDDNGDLMALDELAKEKPADTNARIMRLRTMMAANRDRRRDVLLFGEE